MAASDYLVFVAKINDIHKDVLPLWIKARNYKDPLLSCRSCTHEQKTLQIHKMVLRQLIRQPKMALCKVSDKCVTVPVVNQ